MMSSKLRLIVGSIGLVSVVAIAGAPRLFAEKKDDAASEMTKAATEACKCAQASFAAGKLTVEDAYRWSKRQMQCEQSDGYAKALDDHYDRMNQLHAKVDALSRLGVPGEAASALSVAATKFYLSEAEVLLKKAPPQ